MDRDRRKGPRLGGDLGVVAIPFLVGPSMMGVGLAHLLAGSDGSRSAWLVAAGALVAVIVDRLAGRWLPRERRVDLRAVLRAARVLGPLGGVVVGLVVYAILSGRI